MSPPTNTGLSLIRIVATFLPPFLFKSVPCSVTDDCMSNIASVAVDRFADSSVTVGTFRAWVLLFAVAPPWHNMMVIPVFPIIFWFGLSWTWCIGVLCFHLQWVHKHGICCLRVQVCLWPPWRLMPCAQYHPTGRVIPSKGIQLVAFWSCHWGLPGSHGVLVAHDGSRFP